MMSKNVVLGVAILPGRISIGISAVSKTGVQRRKAVRVDKRLCDGYRHVVDDGDGVGLGYLDGVWGGNWDLVWNADRNGHWAVYWDRNMLSDLNWVGFRHLDGIRAVDGHGVWHLEEKKSDIFDHR